MRFRCVGLVVGLGLFVSAAADGQQLDIFRTARITGAPGGSPVGITLGDFDGDDKVDVVAADSGSVSIRVYLQKYDFYPDEIPVGEVPIALVGGDFDGDTVRDLVVASANFNSVTFLKGHGDGTFDTGGAPVAVDQNPYGLAAGDLDGDGRLDVAVACEVSSVGSMPGVVTILHNAGSGTFTKKATLAAELGTHAVVIGDVNQDGHQDVVALNSYANTVSVYLQDAAGNFGVGRSFPTGAGPEGLAVGFLRPGGFPDLVTADVNGPTVSVLLNDGHGGFGAPVPYETTVNDVSGPAVVAIADMDGDTQQDVVSCQSDNDCSVMLGNGTGTLGRARNFVADGQPAGVAIGDADGDQRPDVFVAVENGGKGSLAILSNLGDGILHSGENVVAGGMPSGVIAADIDNDALPDLVVTQGNGTVLTFSAVAAAAGGGFRAPQVLPAGGYARSPVAADFNGDGWLDVAMVATVDVPVVGGVKEQPMILLMLGRGGGRFHAALAFPVSVLPTALVADDFDCDGKMDLAASVGTAGGYVSVVRGQGDGTFGGGTCSTTTTRTCLISDDCPKDPALETCSNSTSVGDGPGNMVAADINADNKEDLAVVNVATGSVSVLLGRHGGMCGGDGTFTVAATLTGESPNGIGVGFFDADAFLDLAVGFGNVSRLLPNVFKGKGDGTFDTLSSTRKEVGGLTIRDLNGDLVADLATFLAGTTNSVTMLRGDGKGAFRGFPAANVGRQPIAIAAGDFDGDGRYDVATANNQAKANDVTVLYNCVDHPVCEPSAGPAAVRGEGNGDGKWSAADLVIAQKVGLGGPGRRSEDLARAGVSQAKPGADANGDGRIDAQDAHAVARVIFTGGVIL